MNLMPKTNGSGVFGNRSLPRIFVRGYFFAKLQRKKPAPILLKYRRNIDLVFVFGVTIVRDIFSKKALRLWFGVLLGLSLLIFTAVTEAADLPVTSSFGWRVHPITGEWRFHSGVDLGYEYGTPVPALFDGVVVQEGNFGDGYGNQILLYHQDMDCYTRYGHLSAINVDDGESVSRGETIGAVGSTGNSTGPHLHLEYIVKNSDTGGYEYADPLQLWN